MISGAFKNPSKDGYVPAWNNWDVSMNMFDSPVPINPFTQHQTGCDCSAGRKRVLDTQFLRRVRYSGKREAGNCTGTTLSLEYNGTEIRRIIRIPYHVAAKDDAKCITAPADITVAAGQPFTLSYSMQNTGNTYFAPNTYRIMLDSAPYGECSGVAR